MKETRNWIKNKQFKIKTCFFYFEQHVSRILTSPLRIANLVECNSLLSGHYDYYIIVFCFKIKRSVSHSVSDYWPIEFCFRGATPPLCQRLCHRRASLSPSVKRSSNRPSSIRQVESSYICILYLELDLHLNYNTSISYTSVDNLPFNARFQQFMISLRWSDTDFSCEWTFDYILYLINIWL